MGWGLWGQVIKPGTQMLSRTQARRHLWPQLRRGRSFCISSCCPCYKLLVTSSSADTSSFPSPTGRHNCFHQIVGSRVLQHGITTSAASAFSFEPSKHMSYPNHADRYMAQRFLSQLWPYLYRYPVDNRKPLGTNDTNAETKLEILRSRDRLRMLISVGVGATALLVLLGATAVAVSLSDGDLSGIVRSGFSAVYNSAATIAESLGLIMAGVEKKMVQSAVDFVEAGAAAWVMVQVLASVLASAGDSATFGALAWWQPRVASLLADLAAHSNRRQAVVGSGNGLVVDWLLKAVGSDRPVCVVTQAEASRALAHLLSDKNTCESVLGRPHALPYLLHFSASIKPHDGIENMKQIYKEETNSNEMGSALQGKRRLVAAIMDLVHSSCDAGDGITGFRPMLPGKADPADVSAALQVVQGGWVKDNEGEPAGKDLGKSVGVLVSGGAENAEVNPINSPALSFSELRSKLGQASRGSWFWEDTVASSLATSVTSGPVASKSPWRVEGGDGSGGMRGRRFSESSSSSIGLWDDLPGRYVAVTLAAWALATWAQASSANRSTIAHIDKNGEALLGAVREPERTVRWHATMVINFLLQNADQQINEVAAKWSTALLATASQAGSAQDPQLTLSALTALTACVSCSQGAKNLVKQEGLPVLRRIAKETEAHARIQGALAQILDVFTASGAGLSAQESHKWSPILLRWVCSQNSESVTRDCGCRILMRVVNSLDRGGIPISQAWLAMLLMDVVSDRNVVKTGNRIARSMVQNERLQMATDAASQLAKVVALEGTVATKKSLQAVAESAAQLPMVDLLGFFGATDIIPASGSKELPKVTAGEAALVTLKAVKALTELTAEDPVGRQRLVDAGGLFLLRRILLCDDFGEWVAAEASENHAPPQASNAGMQEVRTPGKAKMLSNSNEAIIAHIRKHAMRFLSILSLQPSAALALGSDSAWCDWLEACAEGNYGKDIKLRSYARSVLLHLCEAQRMVQVLGGKGLPKQDAEGHGELEIWPRYEDNILIMNPEARYWKCRQDISSGREELISKGLYAGFPSESAAAEMDDNERPVMDVVFVHGLRGGPYRTWRIAEDSKTSTANGLVEKIDVDAGKKGTCWPEEWLAADLPRSRLLTVKYKTNFSQWSGPTLPLQEVSSILLDKLIAAGVGERPVVFVTHSMGGLVVKQMLLQAGQDAKCAHLVDQTSGIVFYSTPHFGSKLADMPWGIGYVLRPAPTVGELRSGSPRLEQLNRTISLLHSKGHLKILSFSESTVTPLVEGYGGYALRFEVVPIESAYPGFGELVVLAGTDHINSCKPLSRSDPAYTKTLEFLQELTDQALEADQKAKQQ